MTVGYKLIRETFTSRVMLDKPRLKVRVEYIDGPFSHLENIWTFRDEPEGEGSRVGFFIDYEFKSRTLGALMGSMFDVAFRKFAARVRSSARTRSTGGTDRRAPGAAPGATASERRGDRAVRFAFDRACERRVLDRSGTLRDAAASFRSASPD